MRNIGGQERGSHQDRFLFLLVRDPFESHHDTDGIRGVYELLLRKERKRGSGVRSLKVTMLRRRRWWMNRNLFG